MKEEMKKLQKKRAKQLHKDMIRASENQKQKREEAFNCSGLIFSK